MDNLKPHFTAERWAELGKEHREKELEFEAAFQELEPWEEVEKRIAAEQQEKQRAKELKQEKQRAKEPVVFPVVLPQFVFRPHECT